MADYLQQLGTQARIRAGGSGQLHRHGLVYLSGRREGPKAHSIAPEELARREAASELVLRSYEDVEQWVAWCYEKCADPEARIFIGHLLRHIRYRFLDYRDMSMTKPLVDAALENSDALQVAIDYARLGLGCLGQEVIAQLVRQLEASVPDGWTVHLIESSEVGSWIEIRFDDAPHLAFAIRFETKNRFIDLRCGVKWPPAKGQSVPSLTAAMNAAFGVSLTNDWWPWFTLAHEQNMLLPLPADWETSNEPWVMIQDGRLHRVVIAAAARIHGALKTAGLLGLDPDGPLPVVAQAALRIAPVS